MTKYIYAVGIFFAGAVMSSNVVHLIGTSSTYNAAWWKVVASIVVAIFLIREVILESSHG